MNTTCDNADHRNGFAYIALVVTPESVGTLAAHDALMLLTNYLFTGYNFRKLYAETTDRNTELFPHFINEIVKEEARLEGHDFYEGKHWAKLILACYRDEWLPFLEQRLAHVV